MTGAGAASGPDRRIVTVLFVDVSGFVALSARLDPENVAELMNRCFAILSLPVYSYGGVVDWGLQSTVGDCN